MAPPDGDNTNTGTNGAGTAGDAGTGGAADAGASAAAATSTGASDAAKTGADGAAAAGAGDKAGAAADAGKGADAGKADDAGKDAGKDGKAADAIDYTGLKMPEGYTTKTDDPVFGEAVKMFEADKLTPEQAQRYLDFTVERDKAMHKAFNESQQEAWKKTRGEWKAATAKAVSAEDLGIAKTAASKVFDTKTAELLEAYGLTDHQGFVQAMVKIGKAIKDENFVGGNAASNGARDARSHFPNSNMNP